MTESEETNPVESITEATMNNFSVGTVVFGMILGVVVFGVTYGLCMLTNDEAALARGMPQTALAGTG